MLKDIYSPLEIDDQWDQRAPVHEDKVEGGNPDGMSSVPPQMQAEDPTGGGGGVAVAEQQPAISPAPAEVTAAINQEASPEVQPTNEGPGMQADEVHRDTTAESGQGGSITNIGQMIVPSQESGAEVQTPSINGPEQPATDTAVDGQQDVAEGKTMTTETAETEAPEAEGSDDEAAASMLGNEQHDIPASPFDQQPEGAADEAAASESPSTGLETTAMPIESVEPDDEHKDTPEEDAATDSDEEAVRNIVDRPLTDGERDTKEADVDQMLVSSVEAGHTTPEDREITTAYETLTNSKDSLEAKVAKLKDKRETLVAKKEELEKAIDEIDEEIDDKEAAIADVEAARAALNLDRDKISKTAGPKTSEIDLEQAA